ncbi:hypothetical protein [Streptomyces sp. C10-9-1]|uniref:hypothetical protein n=1 Tax=Streptomyces sp. C10-9-1 TaxID=1859285 RepID=UPI003D75E1D6
MSQGTTPAARPAKNLRRFSSGVRTAALRGGAVRAALREGAVRAALRRAPDGTDRGPR